MPSAISYYQATLKVRSLEGTLVLDGSSCGGIYPPSSLTSKGVEADLIILVTSEVNNQDSYIAYSTPCALAEDNNRYVF